MSVVASAHGLAASSGVVAAWVITALILLLLAAGLWAFLRRSGPQGTLAVDRLDRSPQATPSDASATTEVPTDDGAASGPPTDHPVDGPQG